MRPHLAAAALIALFCAASAAAQEAPADPRTFAEVIDVEVTNVDVVVTDRDGRPVTGLRREDFELYEGGERVEISNFYAVEGGRRVPAPDAASSRAEPAVAVAATPEAAPTFLVVYVDNVHLSAGHRGRLLGMLRDFLLGRNGRGDRIMVASYDGLVEELVSFTEDWQEIDAALTRLAEIPSAGHLRETEHRRIIEELISVHDTSNRTTRRRVREPCPQNMGPMADRYAKRVFQEVRDSVAALSQMVATLSSLPGRKALLHVSDGLPMIPGAEIFEFLRGFCGAGGAHGVEDNSALTMAEAMSTPDTPASAQGLEEQALALISEDFSVSMDAFRHNASDLFKDLTVLANSHRVTFFTLDASGPRGFSAGQATSYERRMQSTFVDQARFANLQDTLTYMAQRTGGQAILNTTSFDEALRDIASDLDTYYSLGYRPPAKQGDKVYSVKVKVLRQGARVRYRENLRAKPLAEQLADRTRSALLYDLEDNPLAVEVEVGEIRAIDTEVSIVPLRVRIPLSNVILLEQQGSSSGQLSLYVTTRDSLDRFAPVRSQQVPLRIPAGELAAARKSFYVYEIRLMMRQGSHSVAIGVRDDLAAVASFVTEEVYVYTR